jgi:hypothetical protein
VTWQTLSWDAALAAGTGVALSVRMGNTATPDSSWTDWVPMSASGATIGGVSRYAQYRAVLTTSNPGQTPDLQDVTLTYNTLPDTVAPTVVSQSPAAGSTGADLAAPVVVKFSELMNASTINASTVHLRVNGSSTDVAANVSYAGSTVTLTPNAPLGYLTTYQVVLSAGITDVSGNPLAPTSWTFTTRQYSYLTDTTPANFAAGTPDANTYITTIGDGDLILAPAAGTEFPGTALPAGWTSTVLVSGGSAVVAGGQLALHGDRAGTSATYGPGSSLEFMATFSGAASEHVGFGIDFTNAPWAMFSTKGGGGLYARTNNGSTFTDTLLPGNWLGTVHRFRIDWTATGATFWVDGTQVATQAVPIATSMHILASDDVGAGTLPVKWVHLTPYASSATFVSRVFDAGQAVTWGTLSWDAALPANTAVALSVRMGNTATPDSSWTDWIPMSASGAVIGGVSRYAQYRAALTSTDPGQTPVLQDVSLGYNTLPDTVAPRVISTTPAAGATGVALQTPVVIKFSELMRASTISTSTVHLRVNGSTTDVPARVTYSGSTATLTPNAALAANTTYQIIVSGTVADTSGNPLGTAVTQTFTTAANATWTQTTVADFSAGTRTNTVVTNTSGGEVKLAPTATSGTFVSSVFNATRVATWGIARWTASLPAGTTMIVQTRSGNTATPDSSWSGWTTVSNGGTVSSPRGRYLQYRVLFTTRTAGVTPTLFDISFLWS